MAKRTNNPLGHPQDCACERCEDWRDVQLGLAALKALKKAKGEACEAPTETLSCGECGRDDLPADSAFCYNCGNKL